MRTHETDIPLHLFHHGENFKAYQTMGAHPIVKDKKSVIKRIIKSSSHTNQDTTRFIS